jgi:hypothetical protein
MSKSGETLYMVTLKHLARDGKKAAADLPEVQLSYINARQLRTLVEAVAALGPSVEYPAEPELRVTTPEGKFVVQLKGGKLNLISWSSAHKGGEYSAARIVAILTGEEAQEVERAYAGPAERSGLRGRFAIAALLVGIVAVNSFTIWFLAQPKKSLLPRYTLLAHEPAQRVLENVAGVYETGPNPGDRRLEIDKTGKAQRYKFGTERKPVAPQSFTVQPADAGGKTALLTSRKTMITVKDPVSVVMFGDLYQRVQR